MLNVAVNSVTVRCFTLFVMTVYPDGVCTVDQVIVDINGTTATFSFCGVGSDIMLLAYILIALALTRGVRASHKRCPN